ncbi:MAG TPA: fumarylacetoacetate hydrolase family protein [Candidatus Dormibacteraeota bacterium]|nr:fumarylacetoacetate hydrolase family protein [Candidatus Dormibacteraeota bacterium]
MSFASPDAGVRPGVIDGDSVRAIASATMREFIALPPAQRATRITDERVALAHVHLDAPVRPARNVFCVGRNYLEHLKEGALVFGREAKLPEVPTFFTKATTAIAAPDATLHFEASVSNEYDYEAELAVVVGKRCKDVAETAWREVVFGYTCLNDVTARDLQRAHGQWFKGKSLDDACPLGPWIVSSDEIADPQRLEIAFRRNGIEKQHSNTGRMLFPIARLIAELSRGMTLEPGDVIATGTPEGVGFARQPPEFLHDGDEMIVEIEGIGSLRNHIHIS